MIILKIIFNNALVNFINAYYVILNMDMDSYIEAIMKEKQIPRSQWEHAYALLESEQRNNDYSKLVDSPVQLAHIKDDRLMRLYQNDVVILTNMKAIADRSPEFRPLYEQIYNEWRNEILMSKANGNERKLQAGVGSNYTPRGSLDQGYGVDYMNYMQPQGEEKKGNFLSNLFKKKEDR